MYYGAFSVWHDLFYIHAENILLKLDNEMWKCKNVKKIWNEDILQRK